MAFIGVPRHPVRPVESAYKTRVGRFMGAFNHCLLALESFPIAKSRMSAANNSFPSVMRSIAGEMCGWTKPLRDNGAPVVR
jgi:hypothetical protein